MNVDNWNSASSGANVEWLLSSEQELLRCFQSQDGLVKPAIESGSSNAVPLLMSPGSSRLVLHLGHSCSASHIMHPGLIALIVLYGTHVQ